MDKDFSKTIGHVLLNLPLLEAWGKTVVIDLIQPTLLEYYTAPTVM